MDLIKRNLQEVLHPEILEDKLARGESPRIYWGTAPTGRPHVGYLVPMSKLADLLASGCTVVVLLADLHAFLDNLKASEEELAFRVRYYEKSVKAILTAIGVPVDRLQFVVGRSYQLTPEYTMDLLRLTTVVSQNDSRRAGAEVVKQTDNPALSGLLYPLMQALDEEYLNCDAQFGGVDQRKIFVLAEEQLPRIGYRKRAHLMNPMIPGLGAGGKMSASDPNSKIDILEGSAAVKKKISKAYAAAGVTENNGLLAFVEHAILPLSSIRTGKQEFHINREEKWGGPVTYNNIETLMKDYAEEKLSPADLKIGLTDAINSILAPIQEILLKDPEWAEIERKAYPPPEEKVKKVKKKDKSTRATGAPGTAAPEVAELAKRVAESEL